MLLRVRNCNLGTSLSLAAAGSNCKPCSSSDSNREPSAPQTDASASWATRACSTGDSNPEPSGSEPDASTSWARRAGGPASPRYGVEPVVGYLLNLPPILSIGLQSRVASLLQLPRRFGTRLPHLRGHPRGRTEILPGFNRTLLPSELGDLVGGGSPPCVPLVVGGVPLLCCVLCPRIELVYPNEA